MNGVSVTLAPVPGPETSELPLNDKFVRLCISPSEYSKPNSAGARRRHVYVDCAAENLDADRNPDLHLHLEPAQWKLEGQVRSRSARDPARVHRDVHRCLPVRSADQCEVDEPVRQRVVELGVEPIERELELGQDLAERHGVHAALDRAEICNMQPETRSREIARQPGDRRRVRHEPGRPDRGRSR